MTLSFQRETDDFVAWPLTQNDVTYTGAWSYQIVAYGGRPTGAWITAKVNGGIKGIDIENLAVGAYWVFIRIDGQGSYVPILDPVDLEIV